MKEELRKESLFCFNEEWVLDIYIGLKMDSIKMKITYIITLAFGLNFYLEFFYKKRNFI